jgi:hypothetical protein
MKDVVDLLKGRRMELKTELAKVERALAALEPERKPATVAAEVHRNRSEAQKRRRERDRVSRQVEVAPAVEHL